MRERPVELSFKKRGSKKNQTGKRINGGKEKQGSDNGRRHIKKQTHNSRR